MMIGIVAPLSLMLLFQAKQVHPCADGGGVDDVEAVGNKALAPGLLRYLIEQILKAFRPQSVPQAIGGREIGWRFLGAHAQEPRVDQVKGNLRLHLGIRQILEELQQHHFAHQHWVPGVPLPIYLEVFAVLLDKPKILTCAKSYKKRGRWEKSTYRENGKEGTVGCALFGYGRS
jgi:hypothetical protein